MKFPIHTVEIEYVSITGNALTILLPEFLLVSAVFLSMETAVRSLWNRAALIVRIPVSITVCVITTILMWS